MKQILTIFFVCTSYMLCAQSNLQREIDSMRVVLSSAGDDTTKVHLLLRLGFLLLNTNPDEMIRYDNQGLELALQLDDKTGTAAAYRDLGIVYNEQNKYNKALTNYKDALKIDRALKDKNGEGADLCDLGLVYCKIGNYNKALKHLNRAKIVLKSIDFKPYLATTIANIGWVNIKKMNYTEAMKYYNQALELYKSIDKKGGMAMAYSQLSWLYFEDGKYKVSEDNAVQAVAFAREAGNKKVLREANEMLKKLHAKN